MSSIFDNNKIPEMIAEWENFYKNLLDALALRIEAEMIEQFDKGPGPKWDSLHQFTVEMKGSGEIMIDTGQLKNAIQAHRDDLFSDKDYRRIGVFHETAGRSDPSGKSDKWTSLRSNSCFFGWIHEFGLIIYVTPKMRAWLHYNGLHLSPTTMFITIPERSFIREPFDRIINILEDMLNTAIDEFFDLFEVDVQL